MKRLPLWEDCSRCDRAGHRLAVHAPSWGVHARVVVLGIRASWAAQAAAAPDPDVAIVVHVLRTRLGLREEECVGDALVACGAGDVITPDHVAACSARFMDQTGPLPVVVVAVSRRAYALATSAGLVDGNTWAPCGSQGPVPLVCHDGPVDDLVASVGKLLGASPGATPPDGRSQLPGFASQLYQLLGGHAGHREHRLTGHALEDDEDRAVPKPHGPLREEDVAEHLGGDAIMTPKHSRGPWRFVVVRVPFKASAVHVANFEATARAVRQALPNSYVLESTRTRELRLYVNVPRNMSHGQAALLVRSFLAGRGLRWTLAGDPRGRSVLAEVAVVPTEPVALPFAPGWGHDSRPLEPQLKEFISFLSVRDTRDFDAAEREVERVYGVPERWTPSKRGRLLTALRTEELAFATRDLPSGWATALGDGWSVVEPRLTSAAQRIGGLGVLHDGARDRWTRYLVEELADLVPRNDLERMMSVWLLHQQHVDEQLAVHLADGAARMKKVIDRRYKTLRGVPARFWALIEPRVETAWKYFHGQPASFCKNKDEARVTYNHVRLTAFFTARLMYQHRSRERLMASPTFERFAGPNTARLVREVLVDRSWLVLEREASEGKRSRTFKLREDLWPPRKGEPVLFAPP